LKKAKKCKKISKKICKIHKNGNCITKRCCKHLKGPNKSLKRRWFTCRTFKRCKKEAHSSKHICKFIQHPNSCFHKKCCTTKYLNKKRVGYQCRVGQKQCRLKVTRKCRFIHKNKCTRRYCCRIKTRDNKQVFKTCRTSLKRNCPTITKNKCTWKSINSRCKHQLCCTSRFRSNTRIFHTCFVKRRKCARIQKRVCWKRITKSLKRGKCIHRSCCTQRLINHKLKTIRKSCVRRVKCLINKRSVHTRCNWRAGKNLCRRRVCCNNTDQSGNLLSSKCKKGALHCPKKFIDIVDGFKRKTNVQ